LYDTIFSGHIIHQQVECRTQLRVTLDELLSAWNDLSSWTESGEKDVEQFVQQSVLPLLQSIDPAVEIQSGMSPLDVLENAIEAIDKGLTDELATDMLMLAVLNSSHGGLYVCTTCDKVSDRIFERLPAGWKCTYCSTSKVIQKPLQSAASKLPALDLEHEQDVLKKCIRGALPNCNPRIDVMQNPTFEDLQDRLLDQRYAYDYIHLAGHGDREGLWFPNEDNEVPIDSLVDMFAQHSREHARLQAVVFNAYEYLHYSPTEYCLSDSSLLR
jgi:DNA-directed RNA polymerase subunit RPC12/RpoP